MLNEKDIKKIAIEFREQKDPNSMKNSIVKRFNKIKYGEDVMPCLRFIEWVFGVKNKGLNLSRDSIKHWIEIFARCEEFILSCENEIHDYAMIILHETLAHRYSDYYRFYGKFEEKFNKHYRFSYVMAKKNNIGLHIDGSAYWNGVAYERCKEFSKASRFYIIVTQNRLSYIDARMPVLKVQKSFDFFMDHPEFTPDNISECVSKLEEQNRELSSMLGSSVVIPVNKIELYKKRWL